MVGVFYGIESGAQLKFCLFTFVPLRNRTQVAHDAGKDFAALLALGADGLFADEITVSGTDAEGGRKGEIGQMVICADTFYQVFDACGVFQAFSAEDV